MKIETASKFAIPGQDISLTITVSNRGWVPAKEAEFQVNAKEPSLILETQWTSGQCQGAVCNLGTIEGRKSITGSITVKPELALNPGVVVRGEVSWRQSGAGRIYHFDELTVPWHPEQPGTVIWATLTEDRSCCGEMAVGNSSLFGIVGGALYAVSMENGEILWRKDKYSKDLQFEDIPRKYIHFSGTAYGDKRVYFYSTIFTRQPEGRQFHEAFLHSLDSSSGKEIWKLRLQGRANASIPVVSGNSAYAIDCLLSEDGHCQDYDLYSVDTKDGRINWTFRFGRPGNSYTSPVVVSDHVYIGTTCCLLVIDKQTGKQVREIPVGQVYYTPAASEDHIYILTAHGQLKSLDLSRMFIEWLQESNERDIELSGGTPELLDASIYVHSSSREDTGNVFIEAMETSTGNRRWKYEIEESTNSVYYPKAAGPGRVYVVSRGSVIALEELTGVPKWVANLGIYPYGFSFLDDVIYMMGVSSSGYGFFAIRAP